MASQWLDLTLNRSLYNKHWKLNSTHKLMDLQWQWPKSAAHLGLCLVITQLLNDCKQGTVDASYRKE